MGISHHRLDFGILGDVGFEGDRRPLALLDHGDCLFGALEVVIDAQDLGALAGEGQRGGAAVADAFARALAGPDDDGDFVLEAHVSSLPQSDIA